MKIICQWKDPDFSVEFIDGKSNSKALYRLDEDVLDALAAAGADEYIVVEFDTETGTGRVIS